MNNLMNKTGVVTSKSLLKINDKLFKELRTFEPHGASDRKFMALPEDYDRAVEDIRSMQYKFDQQRLKLKKHLNSPIKVVKNNKTPERIPSKYKKQSFMRFSPIKSYKKLPSEETHSLIHKRLNQIMSSCKVLATESKLALKLFPEIVQKTSDNFTNFADALERLANKPRYIKKDLEILNKDQTKLSKSSRISPKKLKSLKIQRKNSPIKYLR